MTQIQALFGLDKPWGDRYFSSINDSIRGGSSTSYIIPDFGGRFALFTGNLNFTTLGGAGFASQKTDFQQGKPELKWKNENNSTSRPISIPKSPNGLDLSNFTGIYLSILKSDGKTYSINLQDQVPFSSKANNRPSSIEYKYLFTPTENWSDSNSEAVDSLPLCPILIPFYEFVPYYRGRIVANEKDRDPSAPHNTYASLSIQATPINLRNIRSLSIMCASGFGRQSGSYSLMIDTIGVYA